MDNRAYTIPVNPIGSAHNGEFNMVHQTNPGWVLTFVRWENRDTYRTKTVSNLAVRDPLVVENDCLSITTTDSKGTLTPSMSATLVMTDTNYLTAVAPGDFVFVNMLNWEQDAKRVAQQAYAKKPINGPNDGFKGLFKVQGVREAETVDPKTGTKIMLVKINGFGFTEFNNTIYFNPYLLDPNQDPQNQLLFSSALGNFWANLVGNKGLTNVQDIIATLIQSFIGTGINTGALPDKVGLLTANTQFYIPALVGQLMGVPGAKAAKDVYSYVFGIQQYASGSSKSIAAGTNPQGLTQQFSNFWYTQSKCAGDTLLKPEYWNQVKAWSIINQFTNAPLNEIYTTFRTDPTGKVMPTLVFRQMPFTTEDFTGYTVTRFLNLPRWVIHPTLVMNRDIGRDEAARINFVQYFGSSTVGKPGTAIAIGNAQINYVYDIADVQRSGLKPYIVTTQFDEPISETKLQRSPDWAKIMGNILIGGHLKLNGTLPCAGISQPIPVGDNLQLDGVVYHIEQITHTCMLVGTSPKPIKSFRTNINVSSGVSITSSANGTRYAEMTNTNAYNERKVDFANQDFLPGVSESQDIIARNGNVDRVSTTNSPFPQPAPGANIKKKKVKK